MKKLLIFFIFLVYLQNVIAQFTLIPDSNFEQALIDLGIDSDNTINGQLLTIDAENALSIDAIGYNITDLTGIEDFINLQAIDVSVNSLATLDFSENTNLIDIYAEYNPLESINVTQNSLLENLFIGSSDPSEPIIPLNVDTVDLSGNPNLFEFACVNCNNFTSIDVSNNQNLEFLNLAYCNLSIIDVSNNALLVGLALSLPFNPIGSNPNLQSIDISNNPNLEFFIAYGTNINYLNAKNGNNSNFQNFDARLTQNLNCIEVDDPVIANNNQAPYNSWQVDPNTFYADKCQLSLDDFSSTINKVSLYPNPTKNSITIVSDLEAHKIIIYNTLGKIVDRFDVATKIIPVSHLPQGLYFVSIETNEGIYSTKLIKD